MIKQHMYEAWTIETEAWTSETEAWTSETCSLRIMGEGIATEQITTGFQTGVQLMHILTYPICNSLAFC
jgi:hypothetical protein